VTSSHTILRYGTGLDPRDSARCWSGALSVEDRDGGPCGESGRGCRRRLDCFRKVGPRFILNVDIGLCSASRTIVCSPSASLLFIGACSRPSRFCRFSTSCSSYKNRHSHHVSTSFHLFLPCFLHSEVGGHARLSAAALRRDNRNWHCSIDLRLLRRSRGGPGPGALAVSFPRRRQVEARAAFRRTRAALCESVAPEMVLTDTTEPGPPCAAKLAATKPDPLLARFPTNPSTRTPSRRNSNAIAAGVFFRGAGAPGFGGSTLLLSVPLPWCSAVKVISFYQHASHGLGRRRLTRLFCLYACYPFIAAAILPDDQECIG